VELQWMMLANHAEAPGGLLYISAGAWDTINVTAPLPDGAPPDAIALVQGMLVARLSFHSTEAGNEYPLRVTVVGEDGEEIAVLEGDVLAQPQEDAPRTWLHGVNVILQLTGLPLPRFGEYRIHLHLNRDHKGDLPFRVIKRY
jgi:hypothetical protein